jgi:gliding motility-associated-like protein
LKHLYLLLLYILGLTISVSHAQSLSTKGTDFWFGFMENLQTGGIKLSVHISSEVSTSGVVSIPLAGWSQNFTVSPGTITTVTIPTNTAMVSGTETITKKGIHITSSDEVSVYAMNYDNATFDAALILPTPTLGQEYYVLTYDGLDFYGTQYPSEFLIVGTEDNTTVEITPSVKTLNGKSANVPFTITLNQGETYQVQGANAKDLTGTKVVSNGSGGSCYPIAVFGGAQCTYVNACTACDHLYEEMYPIKSWGKNFITVPLKSRLQDTYRVLASTNATSVSINGGAAISLNAGQNYEFTLNQAGSITSNNPILVAEYSQGIYCDYINGDPSILLLSPNEQTLTSATFAEISTSAIKDYYLNVVMKTANTSQATLDGSSITASFSTVTSNTDYSYAQITTTAGSHVLKADSGFLAYVYGFGNAESYAYAAGANLKDLTISYNVIVHSDTTEYTLFNDTICPGTSIAFDVIADSNANVVSLQWDYGDGVKDSGLSVSHVYDSAATYQIGLIVEKNDGCTGSFDTLKAFVTIMDINTSFTIDSAICIGNNAFITYTGFSSDSATFNWDFDGANIISGSDKGPYELNWPVSGTKNISLYIEEDACFSDTTLMQVIVEDSLNAPSLVCAAVAMNSVVFGWDSVAGAYAYEISLDSGNTWISWTGTNGQIQYSVNGLNEGDSVNLMVKPLGGLCLEGLVSNLSCVAQDCYVLGFPTAGFLAEEDDVSVDHLTLTFTDQSVGAISWEWYFGDGDSTSGQTVTHTYDTAGEYTVNLIVKNQWGCIDSITKAVVIISDFLLYIPNAFTPDGDGLNDEFLPQGEFIGISAYELNVFDRWGSILFNTSDLNTGWNGNSSKTDQIVQDGVYTYLIKVKNQSDEISLFRGTLILMR